MKVRFEWTIPNALSILRLLLIPVFAVLYLTSGDHPERMYWSVGVLLLSGLSDTLDGYIARRFNQISESGKLLDPLADKLTQVAVLICVTVRHPALIPLLIICAVKELLQLIGGAILLRGGDGGIEGSHWYGKLATFVFYGVMAVFLFFELRPMPMPPWLLITLITLVAVLMLYAFFRYFRLFLKIHATQEKMPEADGEKGQEGL